MNRARTRRCNPGLAKNEVDYSVSDARKGREGRVEEPETCLDALAQSSALRYCVG